MILPTLDGLRKLRAIFFDPYAMYLFDEQQVGRSIYIPKSVDPATEAFEDVLTLFNAALENSAFGMSFLAGM